jgi:hypothetical protein
MTQVACNTVPFRRSALPTRSPWSAIALACWSSRPRQSPIPDHLIAMAAHGRWWEETHPQHQLSKFLEGACRMAALVTQTGLELDAILLAMLRGARE